MANIDDCRLIQITRTQAPVKVIHVSCLFFIRHLIDYLNSTNVKLFKRYPPLSYGINAFVIDDFLKEPKGKFCICVYVHVLLWNDWKHLQYDNTYNIDFFLNILLWCYMYEAIINNICDLKCIFGHEYTFSELSWCKSWPWNRHSVIPINGTHFSWSSCDGILISYQ